MIWHLSPFNGLCWKFNCENWKKQEYTGFVPFDECFFVKKKLMYKYRLIARSKIIDPGEIDDEEHELLVFIM